MIYGKLFYYAKVRTKEFSHSSVIFFKNIYHRIVCSKNVCTDVIKYLTIFIIIVEYYYTIIIICCYLLTIYLVIYNNNNNIMPFIFIVLLFCGNIVNVKPGSAIDVFFWGVLDSFLNKI